MNLFNNIAMGLLKAYVVASLGLALVVAAVALSPLFGAAYGARLIRAGFRKTRAGTVAAGKHVYTRRIAYLHRVLAVLLFALYPVLFVVQAIREQLPNVKHDMRDLRNAFMGRLAY